MKNESVNKSIYKQTQKGNISLIKRKGNMYKKGNIGLKFNQPTSLTEVQLKALKAFINYYIGKNMEYSKIWNINPKISRSKRQGVRMGKGKSKIDHFIHRYPKSSILLILVMNTTISKEQTIKNILNYKESYIRLEKGLKKIKSKFPKLSITHKVN